MESFALAPASEPRLTNSKEPSKFIAELKVGKTPSPNGMPKRALRNLPRKAVTFLTNVFHEVLKLQHYPAVPTRARVISLLKTGIEPALSSSYRPISLLATVGNLFEKILLSRIITEINSQGLLRDKQFGFRPGLCTTLQLARLVERAKEILTRSGSLAQSS